MKLKNHLLWANMSNFRANILPPSWPSADKRFTFLSVTFSDMNWIWVWDAANQGHRALQRNKLSIWLCPNHNFFYTFWSNFLFLYLLTSCSWISQHTYTHRYTYTHILISIPWQLPRPKHTHTHSSISILWRLPRPQHTHMHPHIHKHTPISVPWEFPRPKCSFSARVQLCGKLQLCWQPKFRWISFLLKSWEFLFTERTHLYFTGSPLWIMGRSTRLFKADLYMDRLGENVQSEQTGPIVSRACYFYSKLFALDIFATSIFPANIFNFFFFAT